MTNLHLSYVSAVILTLLSHPFMLHSEPYDPLQVSSSYSIENVDLTVNDESRSREIPIRVYLPTAMTASPVILFSHGLGGSREGYSYLGNHWASRGYVAVFLQHPGSDDSVWKDVSLSQRMKAMKQAANLKNSLLRFRDVSAVLDQLAEWNKTPGHVLSGKQDLARIGMSGHSFGAITTQAVSGQRFPLDFSFTDPRIKAAVLMSPSSPSGSGSARKAFGSVKIPWMLMTGTRDLSIIGNADMESRLAVFPALPPGGKYEVVLYKAEHSAFSDRSLPGDTEQRNPNHHRVILALSTAFWDSWLKGDTAAKAWLDGKGPYSFLKPMDRWQKK